MMFVCETCKTSFYDTPSSKRRFCSRSCKQTWQSSKPELASRWKGKGGRTPNVHRWVDKMNGDRPEVCSKCGQSPKRGKDGRSEIYWANISGRYLRELSDWVALCRSCHWNFDKPWLKRNRDKGKFI